jgi:aminopeptidase-like protein
MINKKKINKIFDYLFPMCRSISGKGYRDSMEYIKRFIPLKIYKFKSGKKVFDWEIPKEWNITEGYIKFKNKKILDFRENNLHVVNYSAPINKTIDLIDLKKNIFYIKKYPKLIPYVTSYYKKKWGFCLSYEKYKKLKKGKYDIQINSFFKEGYIQNGLTILKGKSKKICLISSYLCHPSMANNELSGPLTLLLIYNKIKKWKNRNLTYYFLINPETIGAVAFLSKYEKKLKKNLHSGIVLTCLGGPKKKLSYKLSRSNSSPLDKIMNHYNNRGMIEIRKFDPADGSDERQYCSGKMNLPVGQISRTVYGTYKEYHTSGDNKKFMNINKIIQSSKIIEKLLQDNDNTKMIHRFEENCELQLGKRNLYPNLSFAHSLNNNEMNLNAEEFKIMINILSYADGKHNIFDIEKITKSKVSKIEKIINFLIKKKLIYLKI